jgi:glyoxylase-like metal-dependent hydrolase (beta-lactamase superfamily II)
MKLYFLAAGYGKNSGYLVQGEDWKVRRYPVLCLLIERDNGDLVLLDTGLGSQQKDDFKQPIYRGAWFNAWMNGFTRVDLGTEALINQLPTLGFDPLDVKTVVVSHLHYDHAGGMKDFPHAKQLVSRREWEAITARTGWSEFHSGCLRPQFEGIRLDIELISTDTTRPHYNFPASYDVFGDGSIVIVDINGHSPGLIGTFVNLPSEKTFFFTSDAWVFPAGFTHRKPKPKWARAILGEGHEADQTIERIHRLIDEHPHIEIVAAHDPRIPGRLNLAPFHYQ